MEGGHELVLDARCLRVRLQAKGGRRHWHGAAWVECKLVCGQVRWWFEMMREEHPRSQWHSARGAENDSRPLKFISVLTDATIGRD